MTSEEALEKLETIICDYKCRLKPDNSLCAEDNNEDELLDIIGKDLKLLGQLETLKNYYGPFSQFLEDMFKQGHNEDLTEIKKWLGNGNKGLQMPDHPI